MDALSHAPVHPAQFAGRNLESIGNCYASPRWVTTAAFFHGTWQCMLLVMLLHLYLYTHGYLQALQPHQAAMMIMKMGMELNDCLLTRPNLLYLSACTATKWQSYFDYPVRRQLIKLFTMQASSSVFRLFSRFRGISGLIEISGWTKPQFYSLRVEL